MSSFAGCPADEAPHSQTALARVKLQKAHDAASEFLAAFEKSREGKRRGTSTDPEQDLLRAMLVFASAGFDAVAKECVRGALPRLTAASDPEAQQRLQTFVTRRAKRGDGPDYKFLAGALISNSPREQLLEAWVQELTAESQQSIEALETAASALGVRLSVDRKALKAAFEARHQIVHEMDLEPTSNRSRRQRGRDEMKSHTQAIFTAAAAFLAGVEANLTALGFPGVPR